MDREKKRIAIIGCGPAGLMSLVEMRKEPSLEPVCFERTDNFGGTWRYREEVTYGQASIMKTTVINHSKEMGAYSLFPPRKDYPNFMKHTELLQYLTEIYDCFGLQKYVSYNTEVVSVKKADDISESGQWKVTTRNTINLVEKTEIFDGVLVGSGHINRPKFAHYPGQETFKGKIIHTHNLKGVSEFKGQNVLIIGMGCSGLDAAVEISSVAKQVYLSTRSGAYVLNRVWKDGFPYDAMLNRRVYVALIKLLGVRVMSWCIDAVHANSRFDMFKVQPKYCVLQKDPIINDSIFSKLMSGYVIQTCDVERFTETGVVFEDGESVDEIDTVVMATGYSWGFPFLEEGILNVEDGRIDLYKCMYPTHLPLGTLAFLAFILPFGPGTPILEMQVRFAIKVLTGDFTLPTEKEMLEDVIKRHEYNAKRYVHTDKVTIRVDQVPYVDELAELIGVKPKLIKYLFSDFQLFKKLAFGPCLPYQYRLEGPGSWEGAREAIMTSEERMKWPLIRSRRKNKSFIESLLEYAINIIPKLVYHI